MQQRIVVEGPIVQLSMLLGSCVLVKKQKEPWCSSNGLATALLSPINGLCQPLNKGSTNCQLLIGDGWRAAAFRLLSLSHAFCSKHLVIALLTSLIVEQIAHLLASCAHKTQ